ncbi:MAG: hypothetical protein J5I94_08615 [Phaeodactylibacter sp.]|nr:hypothetical protein [Phaeodactylibacter sp.]
MDEEGRILTLLNQINFGDEITLEFCSRFECRLTLSGMVAAESTPGAADGQIFLSLNNGIPPFEYSIDGGATFQPSSEFSNLAGGEYLAVIRDANQCEADSVLQVFTCNLMASAEVTPVSASGLEDGRIVLEVTGGLGPYSFSINGRAFQPENVFEGLETGEYEAIIRDEGTGCQTSISVIVDPPVGINEPRFFGRQVKLYPNPTDGYVRIEIRGAADIAFLPLRIYDEHGRLVRHGRLVTYGELTKGVVSLYGLPAGGYYLQFQHRAFPGLYGVVKE